MFSVRSRDTRDRVKQEADTSQLPVCYLGASTGAAAALVAAASDAKPAAAIASHLARVPT